MLKGTCCFRSAETIDGCFIDHLTFCHLHHDAVPSLFLRQSPVSCWQQSILVCQWHDLDSVNKVLLEEVQIVLNIRQEVFVALGSRCD